jgi:hypothetical protein
MLSPLMFGPIFLYFAVPIVYVFFWNDLAYRQIVSHPETKTSLADDLRHAAAKLDMNEKFHCHPRAKGRPADEVYKTVEWMDPAAFSRQPRMPRNIETYYRPKDWDLPLLRRGFNLASQIGWWLRDFEVFSLDTMDPVCKDQQKRVELGLPFGPPTAINGQLRPIFLHAADRTDAAVASYRAIRVPLAILIGLLIAYQVATAVFYVWFVGSMLRALVAPRRT